MIPVNKNLTDGELDELGSFLLDRCLNGEEEKEYDPNLDEGILTVSELDGFLTAIVSGPNTIQPSKWLPVVRADVKPEWESPEEFEHIFGLMVRHMNDIVALLMEPESQFGPLYLEFENDGQYHVSVTEWCEGYLKGVLINATSWDEADDDIAELLGTIILFTDEGDIGLRRSLMAEDRTMLEAKIASAAQEIHRYWLERRGVPGSAQPLVHEGPKVGRNDPCPCGSGKKYKKCCLH